MYSTWCVQHVVSGLPAPPAAGVLDHGEVAVVRVEGQVLAQQAHELLLHVLHAPEDVCVNLQEGRKEMFYLTTHSTHFIYGYMASDIS